MVRHLLFTTFFFLYSLSYAQHFSRRTYKNKIGNSGLPTFRTCHTVKMDSMLRSKYKIESENDFEKRISAIIKRKSTNTNLRTGSDTVTIPVIVHVIHNNETLGGKTANLTKAQVYSQIEVLNEDFNKKFGTKGHNTNSAGGSLFVEFLPSTVDPNGSVLSEAGIHRVSFSKKSLGTDDIEDNLKPHTIYDPNRYLNFWTVRFGDDLDGTLGYAQFPNLSQLSGLQNNGGPSNTDGVVISYLAFGREGNVGAPYNKGRTATHELGHFFGLRHIWGDKSSCQGDDYCGDTPKASEANYGCPSNSTSCSSGVKAMVENYMDYTDDNCMNIFTKNQISRINAVLTNSPRRKELLVSKVYLPVVLSLPIADFSVSSTRACTGETISFSDLSTKTVSSWNWKVTNGSGNSVKTAVTKNFAFQFNVSGTYSVQLIVQNAFGKDTVIKSNLISIYNPNTLALPFFESFEGSEYLLNWSKYNPDMDATEWYAIDGVNGFDNASGSSCLYIDNYGDSTDLTGTKDELISPAINFSSNQNAYLTFDIAYSPFDDGEIYTDTLAILFSTVCGTDFKEFWRKGGNELSTVLQPDSGFFEPNALQWRSEQIPLTFLNGKTNVNIMLKNISGWGNAMYIDNVKIFVPNRVSAPVADFSANPSTICGNGSLSLTDKSTQFPTKWDWKVGLNGSNISFLTSTLPNPAFVFYDPGSYNVTLTSVNSLGSSSKLVKSNAFRVLPNPLVTIFSSKGDKPIGCNEEVTLTGTGAENYYWYDNRSSNPIGESPFLSVSLVDTGFFRVMGFVRDGYFSCFSESKFRLDVECTILGINEVEETHSYKLFPNPCKDVIEIGHDRELLKGKEFKVYDVYGKVVFYSLLTERSQTFFVDHLVQGIYFYTIHTERGTLIKE